MKLHQGDCIGLLQSLEKNSLDSMVTDPPAGIEFMGKQWDADRGGREQWISWMTATMRECFRVLKPGAHALVWAIPRTSHWTAMSLERAGFEVRDVVTHIFGTGFPKSMDISKAIDKRAGGASTENAKKWEGWGTALKPASEHWILVRKPLSFDTVASNVLKYGTGALNIKETRVGFQDGEREKLHRPMTENKSVGWRNQSKAMGCNTSDGLPPEEGRWPANLVLDEYAAGVLDAQSGVCKSGARKAGVRKGMGFHGADGDGGPAIEPSEGASRFFYVAKPSASEKNHGLEGMEQKQTPSSMCSGSVQKKGKGKRMDGKPLAENENFHPTVKSIALMEYLIKLVTPPGGTVLDPFMGSGTTGVAAKKHGFKFVGSEKNPAYFKIAEKRISL